MHWLYTYMLVMIGWLRTVPPSRAVAYMNQLVKMQPTGPLRGDGKLGRRLTDLGHAAGMRSCTLPK